MVGLLEDLTISSNSPFTVCRLTEEDHKVVIVNNCSFVHLYTRFHLLLFFHFKFTVEHMLDRGKQVLLDKGGNLDDVR